MRGYELPVGPGEEGARGRGAGDRGDCEGSRGGEDAAPAKGAAGADSEAQVEGGRSGGGAGGGGEAGEGGGDAFVVRPSKYREMQVAKAPRRKLFDKKRRKVFLEWLAATGNVSFSAAKAGVGHKTVWKHRMKDPGFAEAFDRALEQGIVRAKARLIEDRSKEPIEIDGDLDESALEPPDPERVLALVREYERARAGVRKPLRTPRIAPNSEIEAELGRRLKAYGARVRAERRGPGGDGQAPERKDPRYQVPGNLPVPGRT